MAWYGWRWWVGQLHFCFCVLSAVLDMGAQLWKVIPARVPETSATLYHIGRVYYVIFPDIVQSLPIGYCLQVYSDGGLRHQDVYASFFTIILFSLEQHTYRQKFVYASCELFQFSMFSFRAEAIALLSATKFV